MAESEEEAVSADEPIPERKCEWCGIEFEPSREGQRFHNQRCQQKSYRRQHPDMGKATRKARDKRNRKNLNAAQREYSKLHKDEINAAQRAKYALHREEMAARTRAWRAANPGRSAAANATWRRLNPDRVKLNNDRSRARQLAKLAELEHQIALLKAKLGRPRTREEDVLRYRPRIIELRDQGRSWGQVQRIMNQETGENRSASGWRMLRTL